MVLRIRTAAALCLAFLLCESPAPARAVDPQVQIPVDESSPANPFDIPMAKFFLQNDTRSSMVSLETSATDKTVWSKDRLGGKRVAPGDAFLIELPDNACRYQLRLQFQGTKPTEVGTVNACEGIQLNVTDSSAKDPKPVPDTLHRTIINRFRSELTALRISPTTVKDWGSDLLGRDTIPSGGRAEIDLPTSATCLSDLKADFDIGGSQQLANVDLCTRETVTFNGPVPGTALSAGSGFRIDASGHIMTNNHVVDGCGSMALRINDQWVPLRLVGTDPKIDVAVLQQPGVVSEFLSFRALTSPVRVAERAIAIGFPAPQELSDRVVTEGIVNSLSGVRGMHTRYQLQTPIQPGNSGGPILDQDGLVIGVAVSRLELSNDRVMQDVNFAIKPTVAAKFAESLGVPLRYEEEGKGLSTGDIMDRDGDRVVQLLCRS